MGNEQPDFRTLNYFRSARLKSHIKKIFLEIGQEAFYLKQRLRQVCFFADIIWQKCGEIQRISKDERKKENTTNKNIVKKKKVKKLNRRFCIGFGVLLKK